MRTVGDILNNRTLLAQASGELSLSNDNGSKASCSEEDVWPYGEAAHQAINDSLEPLATHIRERSRALEVATSAVYEVEDIQSLGSLTLGEMIGARERAGIAEQKFSTATNLVKATIENTEVVPSLLHTALGAIYMYSDRSDRTLGFAQRQEELMRGAKAKVDEFFTKDPGHPIAYKTNRLMRQASEASMLNLGAKNIHSNEDGGNADPSLIQNLSGNIQASLVLLGSALDKPLDQFAALLRDATSKVTEADLQYLQDLNDRLMQSLDSHRAASGLRREIRTLAFNINDDIRVYNRKM